MSTYQYRSDGKIYKADEVISDDTVIYLLNRYSEVHDILRDAPELNMDNYDYGEVDKLNDAVINAWLIISDGEANNG